MAQASRDDNYITIMMAGSNADSGDTPIRVLADSVTNRLLVDVDSLTVNDIEDGNGTSVMDTVNNAIQVNVVAGSTSGTEYTEDDAAPANPDAPALSLVRDDALSGQTSADGDIVTARGTDKGELYVHDTDANTDLDTIAGAVSGSEMQVDVVAPLPAGSNAIGKLSANDGVDIGDVSVNNTVTVDLGADNDVQGDVVHDAADSGNPLKVGGVAKETDGTDPGSVAEDDRSDVKTDRNGRVLVNDAHPNLFKANDNQSTAQTNTSLEGAPGAGLSIYVTDIVISTDTATNVKLVEDTGGTPADVWGPHYFPANGGVAISFKTPIRITANTDVGYTSADAANHTVSIQGYIAP